MEGNNADMAAGWMAFHRSHVPHTPMDGRAPPLPKSPDDVTRENEEAMARLEEEKSKGWK